MMIVGWTGIARELREKYTENLKCKICGKEIPKGDSPYRTLSNIYRHFKKMHPDVFNEVRVELIKEKVTYEVRQAIEAFQEAIRAIESEGYFDTNVPYELFEYERPRTEEELKDLLYDTIPRDIKYVLETILQIPCVIYHLKDDIALPEYIVLTEKYVFELALDIPPEEYDTVRLLLIRAFPREEFNKAVLAYYHEV